MVSQTPREHNLSERNDLLTDPMDQENVQGNEEVMVSSEGDTNIDENVTIPNEATVQDPPPLKNSQMSNQVWELVDAPKGIKPIGCKWVYKRKKGVDGKVETFKARLVVKDFTQREGIDYEETFSPVAMLKSIRILLSIAVHYDYEVWQMDVKTAFLNGHLEECIYMVQPDGFVEHGHESKVCKLQRSIYGLKQASRSWNKRFDEVIKTYGFDQNFDKPCVLSSTKAWLAQQFHMKDLGEASYVLGIQILRDRKNKLLALSQATYIDRILVRFSMQDSKKGNLPFRHGIQLSKEQSPKTPEEIERMSRIPYASAVGSLMYAMLCTRPDICYVVGMISRYQSNHGPEHWLAVKHIFKYLRRTRNHMLVYSSPNIVPVGYTDSDFQADKNSPEYVASYKAAKEAVWLKKFLIEIGVVPASSQPMTLYCDNSGAVANAKEPRSHQRGKHIERKYHLLREIVSRRDVIVSKIATEDNLADPFTKSLPTKSFEGHLQGLLSLFAIRSLAVIYITLLVILRQARSKPKKKKDYCRREEQIRHARSSAPEICKHRSGAPDSAPEIYARTDRTPKIYARVDLVRDPHEAVVDPAAQIHKLERTGSGQICTLALDPRADPARCARDRCADLVGSMSPLWSGGSCGWGRDGIWF
ncbi:cysteine-rich RLK (RECEPTOR-like protein kinase) 8 [Abeliophyllum distichum]|uniref:Cysteine-rich RLK (RECEPTOR-like protein kinase) 8 n=1 Tax=Abeliophyllum distichum TaxID=126358 RepID=A0ABD1V7N5_9LAMI